MSQRVTNVLPTPRSGESEDDFVGRCMGDSEAVDEFPDAGQRRAVCGSQFERGPQANVQRFLSFKIGQKAETVQFQGREHLVVPVVALKEMVLHCSNCVPGGELIPAEEIELSVPFWNGVPLPIRHPLDPLGDAVSARSVEVEGTQVIGRFFNPRFEDGSLKGDLFIDVKLAGRIADGPEVLAILAKAESGGPLLEISTSYFAERVPRTGEFEGEKFEAVQRSIRPDHLALLPDETGACSVEAGCGAPRLNRRGEMKDKSTIKRALAVFAGVLGINLEGGMDNRAQLIEALCANEVCPFDSEKLATFSDEELVALGNAFMEKKGDKDAGAHADGAGDASDKGDANAQADAATKAADAARAAANAGKGTQQAPGLTLDAEAKKGLAVLAKYGDKIGRFFAVEDEEHAELVKKLAANKACPLNKETLDQVSIEELRKLAYALSPADYTGRGGPYVHERTDDDGAVPPPPPVVLAEEKKAESK